MIRCKQEMVSTTSSSIIFSNYSVKLRVHFNVYWNKVVRDKVL